MSGYRVDRKYSLHQQNDAIDPLEEASRQRALPRGDAEVAFQRKIVNQGLFFRSLDIKLRFRETLRLRSEWPSTQRLPNVVILEASHARRGFAISWIAQTLVTAALIAICLHAEVVAYVARYASQQEISKAHHDRLAGHRATDAVAEGRRGGAAQAGGRQEHDRAEALEAELVKAWRYVGK